MKVQTTSALVALLSTSVSGKYLAVRGANCNSQPISTGGEEHFDRLESAYQTACAEWSNTNNNATSYSSDLFTLSITGDFDNMDPAECLAAFHTIANSCSYTDDSIHGGSTSVGAVRYKVATINVSDSPNGLEARNSKKTHTTTKHTTSKKTGSTGSTGTGKTTDKKTSKKDEKAATCALKSSGSTKKTTGTKKTGGKRDLFSRSTFLDLIQRPSGPLQVRGAPKPKQLKCGGEVVSKGYPTVKQAISRGYPRFGWDDKEPLKWVHNSDADAKKAGQTPRSNQHVEHLLEWHNVGEHLESYAGSQCPDLAKQTSSACTTFKVQWEGKTVEGKLTDLLARAYPSTSWYTDEFVLLDAKMNSPIKLQIMTEGDTVMTDTTFKKNPIQNLWELLGTMIYLSNVDMQNTFATQVMRMGLMMDKAEAAMVKAGAWKKKGSGLQKHFLTEMRSTWKNGMTKAPAFFIENMKAQKTLHKCEYKEDLKTLKKTAEGSDQADINDEIDAALKDDGEEGEEEEATQDEENDDDETKVDPDLLTTITGHECEWLEAMTAAWNSQVVEHLPTVMPWPNAAGQKRLKEQISGSGKKTKTS